MYSFTKEKISKRVYRIYYYVGEKIMTWRQFIFAMRDKDFLPFLKHSLTHSKDYFWKNVPLIDGKQKFVSYIIETSQFRNKKLDLWTYRSYFKKNKHVVSFLSLNEETMLVSPIPRKGKNYLNIRRFILESSDWQLLNFFRKVSKLCSEYLERGERVWVNTHGLSVYYLHLRFDKSYRYLSEFPKGLGSRKLTKKSLEHWY